MALKTSLIITGDASVARREVDSLATAVTNAGTATRGAAAPAAALDAAQQRLAASAREEAAAIGSINGAIATAVRGTTQATKAANDNADAARRQQFALRNTGQQVGDFGLSIAAGISPIQAFSQQAGQMGYALSEMGGKAGKVGAFLTGPWGIALTIGVAVLAPFAAKLFETGEAARSAELATSGLSDAESILASVLGRTSGKIEEQNVLLRINARLKAANLRGEAAIAEKDTRKTFQNAGGGVVGNVPGIGAVGVIGQALGLNGNQAVLNLAARARSINGMRAGRGETSTQLETRRGAAFDQLLQDAEDTSFKGSSVNKSTFMESISKATAVRANRRIADLIDESLDVGRINPLLAKDEKTRTPKKPQTPKSTEARDEFGRDSQAKIAGIVGAFDGTPDALRKTNVEVAKLDALIDGLNRKKPENFAAIAASAEAAKVTVRDGLIAEIGRAFEKPKTLGDQATAALAQLDAIMADLGKRKLPEFDKLAESAGRAKGMIQDALNRPMQEFLEQQDQQLQIGAQIVAGRSIEAEVLRQIFALEKGRTALSAAQKLDILASVTALRQQERQLEGVNAVQQANLNALRDMQGIIAQTIYEGPASLADLPGRLLDSFKRFQSELISERIFGEMFRDLRDQVLGANKVDVATNTIVSAFGKAAASATQLSGALSGAANPAAPGTPSPDGTTGPDIVVTGRKKTESADIYGEAIGKALGRIGLGKDAASTIGKFAGKGLAGAFEGQAAAGFAGLLGIKTSSTGSAIGGAIGGMTGLPGGAIIGGLLGGIAGKLLAPKAKPGGATVSASDGEAGVAGSVGSDKAGIAAGKGLGGQVASSINQIVNQLGGTRGNFSVQIGKYKDDLRVNVNGKALGGVKGSGASGFGDDENAAINFAVAQAVAQGAVQGVSAAVVKALQSSADVEKALKEALKVQDVELTIGGIGAQIAKQFADLEATAKERVRIAGAYGFDVVAIEKRNAADRLKLSEQLLKQQVGGLQNLITDITSGSLFEGSALDLIGVLNEAIGKAKVDVAAGLEGAGDTLADLYQRKLGPPKTLTVRRQPMPPTAPRRSTSRARRLRPLTRGSSRRRAARRPAIRHWRLRTPRSMKLRSLTSASLRHWIAPTS